MNKYIVHYEVYPHKTQHTIEIEAESRPRAIAQVQLEGHWVIKADLVIDEPIDLKPVIDGFEIIKRRINVKYLERNPLVVTAMANLIKAVLISK